MNCKTYLYLTLLIVVLSCCGFTPADKNQNRYASFSPGEVWEDDQGVAINAHGGGILYYQDTYYWFGEHKGERSNAAFVGVTCYSSTDLYNWRNEGVALSVSDNPESPIVKGSTIERPKVIYNAKTGKFVMYFHLELIGRGYEAAHVGVAVSDQVTGPYRLVKHGRVNAGIWPMNMTEEQRNSNVKHTDFEQWWTPEWMAAIKDGLLVRRDFEGGQMSRDMTLFVDDDGKAYHIYASEENLTLQIAELTDDYLDYTGNYVRVEPGGHNEAPAIFKKGGRYFMITSGCTGWDPNAARLLTAERVMGTWTLHPNPARGEDADLTFQSQSTFVIPVQGKRDAFIFMADRWRPRRPIEGRYIWLPILFEDGMPVLKWFDEWDLSIFNNK
jgi:beta-xylosidase